MEMENGFEVFYKNQWELGAGNVQKTDLINEDKRYRLPIVTGSHSFRWENES